MVRLNSETTHLLQGLWLNAFRLVPWAGLFEEYWLSKLIIKTSEGLFLQITICKNYEIYYK